jgi:hypothetical protein
MFAGLRPLDSQFDKSAPDKIVESLNESATQPRKQIMEAIEMTDALKSINTTPHLCRSKVKQTALEIASAIRPANKFSRVGMSFVERIEAKVRAAIREEVRIHPSKGKTLL